MGETCTACPAHSGTVASASTDCQCDAGYVQHKVPVHRHRDPLRMIVNSAHLPSKFKIAVSADLIEDFKSKKQVREYIEDHVLSL